MPDKQKQIAAVCLWLALLVWAVFGQTILYDFVNYDDPYYISQNEIVKQGLTLHGIQYIFTNAYFCNWHPITSLTNLLDVQLYGLNAVGHHATNVMLHMLTVVALFLVLRNMTGSLWRSALVAVLFAIHPLRVESVAWISERKDVLSGLFFMLTIGAYVRFSKQVDNNGWRAAKGSYLTVLALFTLGLMSKSMLVTLPCVLLLLDFWPLNRLTTPTFRKTGRLLIEKTPLFLLTLIFCIVSMQAQHSTVKSGQQISSLIRLGNVICSYGIYVLQLFRPMNLALLYPYPTQLDFSYIVKILILLFFTSLIIWLQRKKHPFLLVGWLWYLGMLVPVIGWIQIGVQAHADRYTYLPHIGLLIMIVWLIPARCMERKIGRWIVATLSISILLTLTVLSYQQTTVWKNSQTLWENTLRCTKENYIACACLAQEFEEKGQLDRSIELFEQAITFNDDPRLYNSLAKLLTKKGMTNEALNQLEKALKINPNLTEALCSKGNIFLSQSRIEDAFACYRQAMNKNPKDARIPAKIGMELVSLGRPEEAIPYYERAAQLQPNNAEAQVTLGGLLATLEKPEEAAIYFTKALKLDPKQPAIYNYIGNGFLQMGQYQQAIKFFKQALVFNPDFLAPQEGIQKAKIGLMQLENATPKPEQSDVESKETTL